MLSEEQSEQIRRPVKEWMVPLLEYPFSSISAPLAHWIQVLSVQKKYLEHSYCLFFQMFGLLSQILGIII